MADSSQEVPSEAPLPRPGDADRINCYYRISDASHRLERLPHATKEHCLENFLDVFGKEHLTVFADNCRPELLDWLKGLNLLVIETHDGAAKGHRRVLQHIIDTLGNDERYYLVEDDYLHLPGARELLAEGLQIADYATLYDHPDKYMDGWPNGLIRGGGEDTKVVRTTSTHWKYTNSTTGTWASRRAVLVEDRDAWWRATAGEWSSSFEAFCELRHRRVASCLPGRATHTEMRWLSPFVDWESV